MRMMTLSEFFDAFLPILLRHRHPKSPAKSWVFWSQHEGSQNESSSGMMIHEKVKSAFCNLFGKLGVLCQFWAPVTIGGMQLLSTTGQAFAIRDLFEEFAKYRLYSAKYLYLIDVNKHGIEKDPVIRSGGPASAFLNRLPCMEELVGSPFESNPSPSCNRWAFLIMLPICFSSQSSCIGVVECSGGYRCHDLGAFVIEIIMALRKVGLDVCDVQKLIPYKDIKGLEHAKDQIHHALRTVCVTHDLILAQVWIAYRSFSPEDTERMFVLKLTGYLKDERPKGEGELNLYRDSFSYPTEERPEQDLYYFRLYYRLCDVIPQRTVKELALNTLQDSKSRYTSKLPADMLIDWKQDCCAFAVCLRCVDTGDFSYAFEFIWFNHSNTVSLLEGLLLTLKTCLPSFQFSSGAELGDELNVIDVGGSKDGDTSNFQIFQGKRSSPMRRAFEKGNKPMVVDCMVPSKVASKTALIQLPPEIIEKQFGKTMNEAAKNLRVSLSTLKNKCRAHGILEWPGPKSLKKKANDLCIVQINTEDGAIQESSTKNINKNTRAIEEVADHAYDMFDSVISQETYASDDGKIFQGKRLTNSTCKTAAKVLPREVIEKEFGKTMKEAAKNLNVSLATLKRKVKIHGVGEWPGPNFRKRKENDSPVDQDNTSEEYNVAFQEPSTININKDTQPIILGRVDVEKQSGNTVKHIAQNLEVQGSSTVNIKSNIVIIKAENAAGDMIKFNLPISQLTLATLEKQIGMKFKLSLGTFTLKYVDEDGDWICLISDEDLSCCIESCRISSDRLVARVRVVPCAQFVTSSS